MTLKQIDRLIYLANFINKHNVSEHEEYNKLHDICSIYIKHKNCSNRYSIIRELIIKDELDELIQE